PRFFRSTIGLFPPLRSRALAFAARFRRESFGTRWWYRRGGRRIQVQPFLPEFLDLVVQPGAFLLRTFDDPACGDEGSRLEQRERLRLEVDEHLGVAAELLARLIGEERIPGVAVDRSAEVGRPAQEPCRARQGAVRI